MIIGTGIDIVELQRMRRMVDEWGDAFLQKVFTNQELNYAHSKANSTQHIAGRFAVKEAVAKALSTGWSGGFRWKDVEVTNDSSGKPSVKLHGAIGERIGDCKIHISISHSENVIVAIAIIET